MAEMLTAEQEEAIAAENRMDPLDRAGLARKRLAVLENYQVEFQRMNVDVMTDRMSKRHIRSIAEDGAAMRQMLADSAAMDELQGRKVRIVFLSVTQIRLLVLIVWRLVIQIPLLVQVVLQ